MLKREGSSLAPAAVATTAACDAGGRIPAVPTAAATSTTTLTYPPNLCTAAPAAAAVSLPVITELTTAAAAAAATHPAAAAGEPGSRARRHHVHKSNKREPDTLPGMMMHDCDGRAASRGLEKTKKKMKKGSTGHDGWGNHERLVGANVGAWTGFDGFGANQARTRFSVASNGTKIGEIPLHEWAVPFDFDEMSRVNREAGLWDGNGGGGIADMESNQKLGRRPRFGLVLKMFKKGG